MRREIVPTNFGVQLYYSCIDCIIKLPVNFPGMKASIGRRILLRFQLKKIFLPSRQL